MCHVHVRSVNSDVSSTKHFIRFCFYLTCFLKTHFSLPTFAIEVKTIKLQPTEVVVVMRLATLSTQTTITRQERKWSKLLVLWSFRFAKMTPKKTCASKIPCNEVDSTERKNVLAKQTAFDDNGVSQRHKYTGSLVLRRQKCSVETDFTFSVCFWSFSSRRATSPRPSKHAVQQTTRTIFFTLVVVKKRKRTYWQQWILWNHVFIVKKLY